MNEYWTMHIKLRHEESIIVWPSLAPPIHSVLLQMSSSPMILMLRPGERQLESTLGLHCMTSCSTYTGTTDQCRLYTINSLTYSGMDLTIYMRVMRLYIHCNQTYCNFAR